MAYDRVGNRLPELLAVARSATRWPVEVVEQDVDDGEVAHVFRVVGMSAGRACAVERRILDRLFEHCWSHRIAPVLCVEAAPRPRTTPRVMRRPGDPRSRRRR